MVEQIQSDDITGLILAGGQGSRMGGLDKGLQAFDGLPLAQHTLNRLKNSGGVGPVAINANRNLATYESFGVPVWPDSVAGYAGPLAGFLSGMERCTTPFLLTLPCDTPLFPQDLTHRLALALQSHHADIAMAYAPQKDAHGHVQWRPQPVFCLLHVKLLDSLRQFLHAGGRKTGAWTAQHNTVLVPFDLPGDDSQAFANVNTLQELQQLQSLLTEKH